MQKRIVGPNEAGQRLNKVLEKYLKEAPKNFIYKMLRKKNITLNGKKADGTEKTKVGDEITLWLSDETIEKFSESFHFERTKTLPEIIFENEDILLMNKPAGVLSQKAGPQDESINEQMITYLLESHQLKDADLMSFKPSVTNRLDRNTSGLIAAGKSMAGLQALSAAFKDRTFSKYYVCLVGGVVKDAAHIQGYLYKDEKTNKVTVTEEKMHGADAIETGYEPISSNGKVTLMKIELITGRTHQIRAHLAGIGHPIIGDYKYGDMAVNEIFRAKYHLKHQLLHAWRLVMPSENELSDEDKVLKEVAGRIFEAPLPHLFQQIISGEQLKL